MKYEEIDAHQKFLLLKESFTFELHDIDKHHCRNIFDYQQLLLALHKGLQKSIKMAEPHDALVNLRYTYNESPLIFVSTLRELLLKRYGRESDDEVLRELQLRIPSDLRYAIEDAEHTNSLNGSLNVMTRRYNRMQRSLIPAKPALAVSSAFKPRTS